jgi:hypothetical protein
MVGLMMAAANTSETSVIFFFQTTLRNIPEEGCLYVRRCDNLKSHLKALALITN